MPKLIENFLSGFVKEGALEFALPGGEVKGDYRFRGEDVATVERNDEPVTPFEHQLGWKPGRADESLVATNRVFVTHARSVSTFMESIPIERQSARAVH